MSDNGNPQYVPPYNAIEELFETTPRTLHTAMRTALHSIRKANPVGTWPSEPYHYGMGRIKAYEDWLATLNEKELKAELEASRERYEVHHGVEAIQLAEHMNNLGVEIRPSAKNDLSIRRSRRLSSLFEGKEMSPEEAEKKKREKDQIQTHSDLLAHLHAITAAKPQNAQTHDSLLARLRAAETQPANEKLSLRRPDGLLDLMSDEVRQEVQRERSQQQTRGLDKDHSL